MTKIKTLELLGFRGARHSVRLDLTPKSRSVAVFGDNGSGKSSLTDALEWFFTDRVEHLWREDCQAEALRNVNLNDDDSSVVQVDFADGPSATKKVLSSQFECSFDPQTKELTEYLEHVASERIILRNQDLTQFVAMRKGEKRKVVARIIGFDDVTSFRDTIQQTLNKLKQESDYVAAKKTVEGHRAELLKLGGEIITTSDKYHKALNVLLRPFDLGTEVTDDASLKTCQDQLKARIKQEEKAQRKLKLQGLKRTLDSLNTELSTLKVRRDAFLPDFNALIENIDELQKLHLDDFLRKGKAVLEKDKGLENKCPFCLTDIDLQALSSTVADRITQLEATKEKHAATKTSKDNFVHSVNEASRLCSELSLSAKDSPCSEEFTTNLTTLSTQAKTYAQNVQLAFTSYQAIPDDAKVLDLLTKVENAIAAEKKSVEQAEAKEQLTHEEERILEALTKTSDLKKAFGGHQSDTETIKAFETQIRSLQIVFDEFVKVQTSAMQNALNIMSEDIGRFYNAMHPNENVDAVHLAILGDEGVEFKYTFHGQEVHPPMKYLSESHLNSLGVALFLASVKLFNSKSKFFVLDDVVSSFDIGHRRRLLRLLKDEFSDWQVILLTHEHLWFELIRREMKPDGWLLQEVIWDDENGVLLQPTPADFRDLITQKRARGEDIENDLRKLLEQVLKEICCNLEVKVAFRFNNENEKRMPGELLSALQGTLNKKCSSLKGHNVFSKLNGSAFIANVGSHDNAERLSTEDIDLVLQDIDELESLFRCTECNVVASSERFIAHTKTVTCKCGKLSLPWKG